MKSIDMGSIGKNLSLLVLIAVLPALAIILYTGVEQRLHAIGNTREQVLLVTHTMAEIQTDIDRSAQQILSTLAMLPQVNSLDIKSCNTIFKAVLGQNTNLQNITLTNTQGEVLASGLSFNYSNLKDRKHFQQALERKKFSMGEYILSRVGKKTPAIAFAYPVLDNGGNPTAILTTSISLARFSSFYDDLELDEDTFISITDHRGVRLLYYPPREETNPVGKSIQAAAWKACSRALTPGIFMEKGSDGVRRIFAYRPVQLSSEATPEFYMWTGIPEAKVLGPANAILARNLLLMLVAAASALLVSWIMGKKALITPIKELVAMAGKFAKGDLEIPEKPAFKSGELGTLTQALHDMAASLAINRKSLEQNETRLRLLMDSLDAVVYVKDMDTHDVLFINQYGKKQIGDITGTTCWQTMQKDQNGPCSFCTDKYLLDDQGDPQGIYTWEFQNTITGRWYYIRDRAIKWIDGRLVRLEIATDITEKKETDAKIAEERERLAVTLRSIGDGVITTDTQSRICLMNTVAETLTGWSTTQAAGRSLTEIFNIVDMTTDQACKNPVEKVLASGETINMASPMTLISKNGDRKHIADSASPILDMQGNVTGVVLVFRDVTEQLCTEQELRKITKLESIGVLAGGIAHDYNNILSAIIGNIQLTLMDSNLTDRTQRFIKQALDASLRAKNLTIQLLTFSKGGRPVKKTASLVPLIRDFVDSTCRASNIACHCSFPDDLWPVEIDRSQMGQVVQKLIQNACNAMPNGGTIEVSCQNVRSSPTKHPDIAPASNRVEMSIKDTGVGIAENLLDKIFDPYFSTNQPGRGLGLAICHSIVTQHNGQISVKSTPGKGSTFTVHLPASTQRSESTTQRKKSVQEARKLRILIMDDEEMLRDLTRAMLTDLGHDTFLAKDGVEAIEVYKKAMDNNTPIDLTIMDLTIPGGMGGKEAVQKLLKINPKAKVIVSSGYSNDPVMADFKAHGFCATLSKPSRLADFTDLINRFTDQDLTI